MGEEKLVHGQRLVELLESSDAIPTQSSIIIPEKVNGYNRQGYCFFYGAGIDTGIVLMEWEVKPKKHEPAKYHSLSAVNLSDLITNYLNSIWNKPESPDYGNIASITIDKMIKQRLNDIPLLLTHDYKIAEEDIAVMMYNAIHHNLGINHPKANELSSLIKQYERKPVLTHSANPETLIPGPQTSISLGRY